MAKYLVSGSVVLEIEATSEREAAALAYGIRDQPAWVESARPISVTTADDDGDYFGVVGPCECCGSVLLEGKDSYQISLDGCNICEHCCAKAAYESEAE